jgi:DNA-binding NarL/FixJ family response regulator
VAVSVPIERGDDLTPCELTHLRAMAAGEKREATALRLGVSPATVQVMRRRVLRRLDAFNAPHAVAIAFRRGWLD